MPERPTSEYSRSCAASLTIIHVPLGQKRGAGQICFAKRFASESGEAGRGLSEGTLFRRYSGTDEGSDCCLNCRCVEQHADWSMRIRIRRTPKSLGSPQIQWPLTVPRRTLVYYCHENFGLGPHQLPSEKIDVWKKLLDQRLLLWASSIQGRLRFRIHSKESVASHAGQAITANHIRRRFAYDHMQNRGAFARMCLTLSPFD